MNFRGLIVCSIVGAFGVGCANQGPAILGACIHDPQILAAYQEFQRDQHENFLGKGRAYLTGGYDADTNTVNCYWQTHSLSEDVLSPASNPLSRCYSDRNEKCAILMDGPRQIFAPKETSTQHKNVGTPAIAPVEPAAGADFRVLLFLIGEFAEGMARGLAKQNTVSSSIRPVLVEPRQPIYERPLRCTRDIMPGPSGYGYTCQR